MSTPHEIRATYYHSLNNFSGDEQQRQEVGYPSHEDTLRIIKSIEGSVPPPKPARQPVVVDPDRPIIAHMDLSELTEAKREQNAAHWRRLREELSNLGKPATEQLIEVEPVQKVLHLEGE